MTRRVRLNRRSQVHATLVGIATGMVVAGLLVPFTLGDRVTTTDLSTTETGDVAAPVGGDDDTGARATGETTTPSETTTPTSAAPGVSRAGAAPRGSSTGPDVANAGLRSSDQGVSETTIKVGFLLLDIASATRFAGGLTGIDPEQQRKAIEVYLTDLNERGGIHGRQVDGVYRTFDVLSRDDQRAACLELTEDKKVFAVIAAGGFGGPPVLCITEEHGVPFINLGSGGAPTQYAERSGSLLFTLFQLGNRQMNNWVHELDARRALAGKRIGILSDENTDPGDLVVGGALLPALERVGHKVIHRSRLSADLAVGASQIPVEVNQMRTKQVEVVLLPAHSTYASQFAQNAENQGWTPKWYATDFGNMSSDAIAENMPDGFEGALALTVTRTGEDLVGAPEPQVDADCRTRYEQRTGERLPRVDDEGDYNNTYGTTLYSCGMINLFESAAAAVGPELTRQSFSTAMQGLGDVALPRFGGASFRPGKFDATDLLRTNRWYRDCTCWKPIDEFRPARF